MIPTSIFTAKANVRFLFLRGHREFENFESLLKDLSKVTTDTAGRSAFGFPSQYIEPVRQIEHRPVGNITSCHPGRSEAERRDPGATARPRPLGPGSR